MKLEITKEKVLEAAAKCSTAKETLKTLFPEVFEDDKHTKIKEFQINTDTSNLIAIADGLAPNGLEYKCFCLNGKYNWELDENYGTIILIPTKK